MKDIIRRIKIGDNISQIVQYVVHDIYTNGPANNTTMEILCYLSIYQPQEFEEWKNKILKYMGVYYKLIKTDSFPEVVFGMYEKHIEETYNNKYTPVQANIVNEIENNKCFSFSAPTSTGKSYVFRHLISSANNDIVIVVPSRVLINEYYNTLCENIKDKSVNILTFIDKINIKRAKRNIFIVTPERCKELFRQKEQFVIDIFLFDEAQISNEETSRGIFFDSIVRRAQKAFPDAKFVFAHPFVENPEAQINKNHFNLNTSDAKCYKYRNVGQMFYAVDGGKYYHFGISKEVMGRQKVICEFDPVEVAINNGGSVLIYTTKASIYNKKVFSKFEKYINMCPEINDKSAKKYIKQIKKYIGANDSMGKERYSQMLDLMKHGIVIHHGSLPLQARLLLEQFTNKGYCRICFATSTLEQGINMPFDVVYLNTFEASKPLSLKNLIGRAGRSTTEKKFDFGSIVVKVNNMSQLREIINSSDVLEDVSMLESEVDDDLKEFKESIINGTISDEYNITEKQLIKLKDESSENIINNILNTMFETNELVSLTTINEDQECKLVLYDYFKQLYEYYLGRSLCDGEKQVFNTAIKILLWQIHCKSFKDICFYRYSYASKKKEREQLQKEIEEGNEFERHIASFKLQHLYASFISGYAEIPNKNLQVFSMFGNNEIKAIDVDYDRIVFDTYDYLDKIIGFKLSDIFYAAFNEYYEKTGDIRAKRMAQLVKYRTENEKEIWMLRYGFSFEDIEWLEPYVEVINQEEIIFSREIDKLPVEKMDVIKRFV